MNIHLKYIFQWYVEIIKIYRKQDSYMQVYIVSDSNCIK